eukprot:6715701-Karenia_brevis.AAC.1
MHAAASRMAALSPGAKFVTEDIWVKAHRKPAEQDNDWDAYTASGNEYADLEAVAAQSRLELAGAGAWARIASMQTKMKA